MVKYRWCLKRRKMPYPRGLNIYSPFFSARGGGWGWCILLLLGLLFIPSTAFTADLGLDDIIQNIQTNQSKIKDIYAETTTTITSNLQLTTDNKGKSQTMIQKGKMWTKGKDKSKIEMISPTRQITITNGDKTTIINPDSGQAITQDLSKIRAQSGFPKGGSTDLSQALDYFDLSVEQRSDQCVIIGKPKQANKFLGKMEFYVDSNRWLPVKILMYDSKGKIMSQSMIEYEKISDVWVSVKNASNVITPMGAMKVEMEFENVKVNQGIADSQFEVK